MTETAGDAPDMLVDSDAAFCLYFASISFKFLLHIREANRYRANVAVSRSKEQNNYLRKCFTGSLLQTPSRTQGQTGTTEQQDEDQTRTGSELYGSEEEEVEVCRPAPSGGWSVQLPSQCDEWRD